MPALPLHRPDTKAVSVFEYVDALPPVILTASREEAPSGFVSHWFVWTERGRFRLDKVLAMSWHEARKLGAEKLGELVEHVDAAREVRLAQNFGVRA